MATELRLSVQTAGHPHDVPTLLLKLHLTPFLPNSLAPFLPPCLPCLSVRLPTTEPRPHVKSRGLEDQAQDHFFTDSLRS